MADISTATVRAYIAARQQQGVVAVKGQRKGERLKDVSNAEINRELALLKRMYSLAIQAGVLFHKPHIPLLEERNVRAGFFEPAQLTAVLRHLPPEIRPVIQFAAITGWRVADEVLPLEWRQVHFDAGEVALDPHSTKNDDARTFPMTADLRALLQAQHVEHERLQQAGHLIPNVFWRLVAKGRGGEKTPRPIISFTKTWKAACRAAGCPGRIPHDLRRTAVRRFVRANIGDKVAMALSGHKTRSVFERYNIVSPGDLRDAARRLDAVVGGSG